ncbi:MAG: hypothetical protein ABIS50_05595 [Luteolibacter sp.]|uniref:RCC1 domain-containing protein n=1 Tax=Luteolibacter sp. TaxID=1962973 RepID=UPI003262E059
MPTRSPVSFHSVPLPGRCNFLRKALSGLLPAMLCVSATAATVTAAFKTAASVPLKVSSYDAAGDKLQVTLGFAPSTGASLTVIENKGAGFIAGRFSNLAQGRVMKLTYGGITYRFVADYYGGTGNDLVLHWAYQELWAWGYNDQGQLGTQTIPQNYNTVPVPVSRAGVLAGKTILHAAACGDHNLALCSDGVVAAWGYGFRGELGNGSWENQPLPVRVDSSGVLAGKTVVAVAAGEAHALALCSDGTVASWGSNEGGQLGTDVDGSNVPVRVSRSGVLAGKTVVAIAAGHSHSLALCSDGKVVAWGLNSSGELGNGKTVKSGVPVLVKAGGELLGKTVVGIAAGYSHSLALCSDGTIVAWGDNSSGQLGNGTKVNSSVPVLVIPTEGAVEGEPPVTIGAGAAQSFAVCTNGQAFAWGGNLNGELGNNQMGDNRIPSAISTSGLVGRRTVASVTGGYHHTLLFSTNGTATACGSNSSGELGNGTQASSLVPVPIAMDGDFSGRKFLSGAGGLSHSLAVVAVPLSGDSQLAGLSMSTGALGYGFSPAMSHYVASVSVKSEIPLRFTPVVRDPKARITVNGMPVSSGSPSGIIVAGTPLVSIVVTSESCLSSATWNVALQWSRDKAIVLHQASDVGLAKVAFDATGLGLTVSLDFAPSVGTNLTVIDITGLSFITGRFKNLAPGQTVDLPFGGKTYHFVANYHGGTGNDLVLEWAHRSIAGWGDNGAGQLGVSPQQLIAAPVAMADMGVLSGRTITSIASGAGSSAALCADGTVAVWGYIPGALGAGGTSQSSVPISIKTTGVLAGKSVAGISAASGSGLAVCTDGSVVAWGANDRGQLGDGTTNTPAEPVKVSLKGALASKSVVAVAVGGYHSLAICSDGSVLSWGGNPRGQLGDGTNVERDAPVLVSTAGVLAGKTVVAVSAGLEYSLALCSDGMLAVWGRAGFNDGHESWVPRHVDQTGILAGKTVVALSQAAHSTPTVLCSDGTVVTWGENSYGQRGNTGFQYSEPAVVTTTGELTGKTVSSVASGGSSSLAICSDGSVVTWGDNQQGQLGNEDFTYSSAPVPVTDNGVLTGGKPLFATLAYHALLVSADPDDSAPEPSFNPAGPSAKAASGASNLLEYVLRCDPATASSAIHTTASADGTGIAFGFSRLAASAADTSQVFEYSSDMTAWTPIAIVSGPRVTLGDVDTEGNQEVTVTIPRGDSATLFGRLRISRP